MRATVAALLAGLSWAPAPAWACHESDQDAYLVTLAAGMATVDLPLTIHDVAVRRSSKPYAMAELVLAGAMLGYTAYGAVGEAECEGSSYSLVHDDARPLLAVPAAWNLALAVHALVVLAREDAPAGATGATAPRRPGGLTYALAPALHVDGERSLFGLTAVGTF